MNKNSIICFIISLIIIGGLVSTIFMIDAKQYLLALFFFILLFISVINVVRNINRNLKNKKEELLYDMRIIKITHLMWFIFGVLLILGFALEIMPATRKIGFIYANVVSLLYYISYCELNFKLYKKSKKAAVYYLLFAFLSFYNNY